MSRQIGRKVTRANRRKAPDRYDILAEIKRKGGTLNGIAKDAGIEPSACRTAMRRRNVAGELAIAKFLGVDVRLLWPDRYASCNAISATSCNAESSLIGAGIQTGDAEVQVAA